MKRLDAVQLERSRTDGPDGAFGYASVCDWESIASLSPALGYPGATELFMQGSSQQEVFFVDHGLVKLVHTNEDGIETIIGLRSSGWPLGAAAAILHQACPFTATTVIRCQIRRVLVGNFLDHLQRNPQFACHLNHVLSRELHDQISRLVELASLPARLRVEQLLRQLITAPESSAPKQEVRVTVPLKQWELAQLLAVTPAYLSRLLDRLEQNGTLTRRKGWIFVPDATRLHCSR